MKGGFFLWGGGIIYQFVLHMNDIYTNVQFFSVSYRAPPPWNKSTGRAAAIMWYIQCDAIRLEQFLFVFLGSLNKASTIENNVLDQIYEKELCSDFYY